MTPTPQAIGGYFELALTRSDSVNPFRSMYAYHSARAALLAVLKAGKPATLWLPNYICDAVIAAANASNVPVLFYNLNPDLSVKSDLEIGTTDWLLYVNYFGICDVHERALLQRFAPSKLIFDHAQALFSPPLSGVSTIYSPRKFLGLPDGGLLSTSLTVEVLEPDETASLQRCQHLLKRLALSPEAGYADYQNAETTLTKISTAGMSNLTRQLLNTSDMHSIQRRRNRNFRFLHKKLKSLNQFSLNADTTKGPLCYPFLPARQVGNLLRATLLEQRIFVPRYWPEAVARSPEFSLEYTLATQLLPLPCDQRYDESDLSYMAELIIGYLHKSPRGIS